MIITHVVSVQAGQQCFAGKSVRVVENLIAGYKGTLHICWRLCLEKPDDAIRTPESDFFTATDQNLKSPGRGGKIKEDPCSEDYRVFQSIIGISGKLVSDFRTFLGSLLFSGSMIAVLLMCYPNLRGVRWFSRLLTKS